MTKKMTGLTWETQPRWSGVVTGWSPDDPETDRT